jgi:hypothetical protein
VRLILLDKETYVSTEQHMLTDRLLHEGGRQLLKSQIGHAWFAAADKADVDRVEKLFYHISRLHAGYTLQGKINGSLLALEAMDSTVRTDMESWRDFTNGSFKHVQLSGNHTTVLTNDVESLRSLIYEVQQGAANIQSLK